MPVSITFVLFCFVIITVESRIKRIVALEGVPVPPAASDCSG